MNRGLARGLPRELPSFRGLSINSPGRSIYFGEGQSSQATGSDMVVLGDGAGPLLRGGNQTVIIGSGAGQTIDNINTTTNNVFIGYQAAQLGTSSNNVCIGASASVGTGNGVSIGQGATLGAGSAIAIGTAANSTGNDAIAIGQSSLATTNGVSVGFTAGHAQTGSPVNTFIGFQAGYTATSANATTTGTRQTCVGNNAGANTATQLNDIVCIGDAVVTGGSSSTIIGASAAGIGSDVYVGYQAGQSNVGTFGTGVGYQAGKASNSQGVAIGYQAGLTLNGQGVAIGYLAGTTSNASGVAIGFAAGLAGSATCTFVGNNAGRANTATSNTFIGYQAGYTATAANATTTGAGQVCLGQNAGANTATQLSFITCLGTGVQAGASGVIAIGADSAGTAATSSVANEIVLGTTLHGLRLGNLAGSLTATTGYPYLPLVAGTPTGVPAAKTNYAACLLDSTAGKLWAYYGAAWHFVTLT